MEHQQHEMCGHTLMHKALLIFLLWSTIGFLLSPLNSIYDQFKLSRPNMAVHYSATHISYPFRGRARNFLILVLHKFAFRCPKILFPNTQATHIQRTLVASDGRTSTNASIQYANRSMCADAEYPSSWRMIAVVVVVVATSLYEHQSYIDRDIGNDRKLWPEVMSLPFPNN